MQLITGLTFCMLEDDPEISCHRPYRRAGSLVRSATRLSIRCNKIYFHLVTLNSVTSCLCSRNTSLISRNFDEFKLYKCGVGTRTSIGVIQDSWAYSLMLDSSENVPTFVRPG